MISDNGDLFDTHANGKATEWLDKNLLLTFMSLTSSSLWGFLWMLLIKSQWTLIGLSEIFIG